MITTADLKRITSQPGYAAEGEYTAVKNKGGRPRKVKTSSEHLEQVKLFAWANSGEAQETYPQLAYLFAIPNGGARHPAVGFKLKREGVKPGILDIFLPVARGGFHGLFVEMKYGSNWLSKEQDRWVGILHDQGYSVAVCKSSDEAKQAIVDYLEGRTR